MARLDHDFAGLSLESSAGKALSSSPLLGYEIDSALSSGAGFAGRIAVANAKWKPQDKRAVLALKVLIILAWVVDCGSRDTAGPQDNCLKNPLQGMDEVFDDALVAGLVWG